MRSLQKRPRVLVFSIALNGYHALYRDNFASHKSYAATHGYTCVCVDKPRVTSLGMECAWLKIALVIRALANGFDWVMFLDADTRVNRGTPPVTSLGIPGKSLYVAKGYSGRLNSGVLIIRNCPLVLGYFEQTLEYAEMPLPPEDDVGWGENGHLIHFARNSSFVHYLEQRWNNNADADLDDYIRHYSYGPLHRHYHPRLWDRTRYLAMHCITALAKRTRAWSRWLPGIRTHNFRDRLDALAERVAKRHRCFQGDDRALDYQRRPVPRKQLAAAWSGLSATREIKQ